MRFVSIKSAPRSLAIVAFVAIVAIFAGTLTFSAKASARPATKVFLNGVPSPVYFNDGDSFTVLGGPYAGSKARLAGFNTLESYGGVHFWGDWTPHELYINAKMGTLNARRGVWRCTSDLSRDGYGRILWDCPGLTMSQVRLGLAHAMTVTPNPSSPELLAAQHAAQRERRGMWAHGVPEFVLTSTHSASEPYFRGRPYNRLVSSKDGHSEKWRHGSTYAECENVCRVDRVFDESRLVAAAQRLREYPELREMLAPYSDVYLLNVIGEYARCEEMAYMKDKAHVDPVKARLEELAKEGAFGSYNEVPGACMVFVDFKRRYGQRAAACLP